MVAQYLQFLKYQTEGILSPAISAHFMMSPSGYDFAPLNIMYEIEVNMTTSNSVTRFLILFLFPYFIQVKLML